MPIRILPSEVASQIAAGEVVERPASVVKELVENALDAKAGFISIKVLEGGRKMIEVADDGIGVPFDELPLAVERHATSKLSNADDLFKIETLGFRGEALASIGSVSRMTMTSRNAESDLGGRLYLEGGEVHQLEAVGAPVGTVVKVENLFFNVPARLKFLKTEATERRLIDNLVTRYALAFPEVRFHLLQEDRKTIQTSGNGDRREVLGTLYGAETAREMLEVIYKDDLLSITGFLGPTFITRTHRRGIHFFINGRPIQDSALGSALIKGYHTLLMVGRYPLAVLILELPSESVDVNVHPTKAEVRFRDPNRVFSGVQNAVRRALLAHNPVPMFQEGHIWGSQPRWNPAGAGFATAWESHLPPEPSPEKSTSQWDIDGLTENITRPADSTAAKTSINLPGQRVPILRPVGQVANAYLVAEGPDGLYLIDQHAAHERVLFERFLGQANGIVPAQALLQPIPLELPAAEAHLLEEQIPILSRIGFHIEPFGPQTFLVRSMPVILGTSDPTIALRSLVDEFEENEAQLQNKIEQRIIARICKRAAVKAGTFLSPEEQRSLLLDLEGCQSPRTCPHGRPTMIHLSVDLLERQFGRKGAR